MTVPYLLPQLKRPGRPASVNSNTICHATRVHHVRPSVDAGARAAAVQRLVEVIGEPHAFSCQPVKVWGLHEWMAGAPHCRMAELICCNVPAPTNEILERVRSILSAGLQKIRTGRSCPPCRPCLTRLPPLCRYTRVCVHYRS